MRIYYALAYRFPDIISEIGDDMKTQVCLYKYVVTTGTYGLLE